MHLKTLKLLVFLGISALATSGPLSQALADSFRLEAETFTNSGNAGGAGVEAVACSGASNGRGVKGVDSPGDWMAWRHEFTTRTCFTDSLRSQGQAGFARDYAVLYEPDFPATTSSGDTTLTATGAGIG
jgi:hypothetical protein